MNRKGDCWDNACSETLFGSLKVERLHGMRFETRRCAKDEAIYWLLWYDSRRLHSTLGYLSPMQYEQRWLAALPKTANMCLGDSHFEGKVTLLFVLPNLKPR